MKKEGGGDEIELSLELSIGGNYGKSENSRYDDDKVQCPNPGAVRSNFSENGCEYPQRRREIQAFRRHEARKRRVEKLKRSRTVEDGAVEGLLKEPPCKKKGVWSDGFAKESSPSSATESKIARQKMEQDCSYRNAQCVLSGNGLTHPFWVPNIGESKKSQANVGIRLSDCDSIEHGSSPVKDHGNWRMESNRSLERSTSVVSDYQSTSTKGGSSSGTGSHVASRSIQEEQLDGNTSSPTEPRLKQLPDDCTKLLDPSIVPQKSKASFCLNQSNDTCSPSSVSPPSQHGTDSESEKPIRPPVRGLSTTPLPHMPCVSATGNGPNGKTITGFLYRYTKTEVSIVCVCHGNSFSPAEFVEHAGGVDISHPLRHITIVPSSF